MSSVSLQHISKVYPGGVTAVSDFSLEIQDREFIVLTGPSGCGKSTVLRMVAGLEDITEGEVYIDGKLVNGAMPKDRDVAMVLQNFALYPHMTVYENMAYALKLRKAPRQQIKERVEKAADLLEISHLLGRRPKALSLGQRQQVALGRAIVREPKVFLMDEPLSNLDAKLRARMRAEIIRLHQKLEATMIYVTHDQTEAMTMADRIVIMKDGVLQQADTPQNNYDYPVNQFVAGFIGAPQMNFFDARLRQENGRVTAVLGDSRITVPPEITDRLKNESYIGQDVILGVRPENIGDDPHFVAAHPDAVMDVRVESTEQLGGDTFLYFTASGQQDNAVARVNPRSQARADERVKVALDAARLHLFDKTTEETILNR